MPAHNYSCLLYLSGGGQTGSKRHRVIRLKRDGAGVLQARHITAKKLKRASRRVLGVIWVLVRYEAAVAFIPTKHS
jgi:hypothetical protein